MANTNDMAHLNRILGAKHVCALCGFETGRIRFTRLNSDHEVLPGFFGSRTLGAQERFELGEGEHAVCGDRRGCEYRQNKKRFAATTTSIDRLPRARQDHPGTRTMWNAPEPKAIVAVGKYLSSIGYEDDDD